MNAEKTAEKYLYATARIRALENSMIGRDGSIRLCDARSADEVRRALDAALAKILRDWPGVGAEETGDCGVWRIVYPKAYDIGHEAHFSQVTRNFLKYLAAGALPAWEKPNMLVKYYTLAEAWKASR